MFYKITITPTEKEKNYRITWYNPANNTEDTFEQIPDDIILMEKVRCQTNTNYQLDIGEKIFYFLDGNAGHLKQALDSASKQGLPLQIRLCTCNEVDDWPFELLAYNGAFLLPKQVHLVRCISNWGENRIITPQNRPLKLLFMACSAVDVNPVLNFENEEETIFKITDSLPLHIDVEDTGSLNGLHNQLQQELYDIIHLSGHADIDANGEPYFVMEDETGHGEKVSPERLWNEALSNNPPVIIFLSGCRTGQMLDAKASVSFARRLIENRYSSNLSAVLGWGGLVVDSQATFMENRIYHDLSQGKSILDALVNARSEVKREYPETQNPAWPLLRLFCCGNPPDALIKKEFHCRPTQRRMKHFYLKDSNVKVLKEGFVGRRRELQQSLITLKTNLEKVGVLLLGMGGLGKSCLAGKICERFAQHILVIIHGKFQSTTLQQALKDAFIKANDQKGIEILNEKMDMADKLANLCSNSFKINNYLILLDDFEQNLEGAETGQPQYLLCEAAALLKNLLYYLPYSEKSTRLIITCRYSFSLTFRNMDLMKERLEWISLTAFGESEQKKKVRMLPNIYNYQVKELTSTLIAAGYGNPRLMELLDMLVGELKNTGIRQLLDAIKDKQEEFIRTHIIRELLHWGGVPLTRLLQWCSIYRLPVQKEGIKIMADKAEIEQWEKLVEKAIFLTLLDFDQARKSYQVSPLLKEELRTGIDDIKSCQRGAFEYYQCICEPKETIVNKYDLLEIEEWIYHALSCGEENVASKQGGILVNCFRDNFTFRESVRLGKWILSKMKRKLKTKDDSFLLNALAYSLNELGNPQEAIEYYEKALAIDQTVYGENHPEVAVVLNNMGTAFEEIGDYRKAIRYYRKSLAINYSEHGLEHSKVALQLNNIGSALYKRKRINKAISCFESALTIGKKFNLEDQSQNCLELASILNKLLNNLGAAYKAKGRLNNAIDFYKQALDLNLKFFGEEHPDFAIILKNLGSAYVCMGQKEKAKIYFEKADAINNTSQHSC